MFNRYRFRWIVATLILFSQFSCAGFEHFVSSVGEAFKGNTRKTIADFDLEDKKEYRNYYYLKHKEQREEAKKILYWMDRTEPSANTRKNNSSLSRSANTNSSGKDNERRNVFQKLFKVRQP